jgi:inner membrane protein
MGDWLSTVDSHWFWLSIGLGLAAIEMIAPGFFLMWLGAAAIIVGLMTWGIENTWGFTPSLPFQVALFAVISVLTVYAGKRFFAQNPIESDDPLLNDRGARLTGEIVTVTEAISDGRGRVRVGDTEWSARGTDAAVGARVRVAGADGAVLLVEEV